MEFMETIVKIKPEEHEIAVHLITTEDDYKNIQQQEFFEKIKESSSTIGIDFTYELWDLVKSMPAISLPIMAGKSCWIAASIFFSTME